MIRTPDPDVLSITTIDCTLIVISASLSRRDYVCWWWEPLNPRHSTPSVKLFELITMDHILFFTHDALFIITDEHLTVWYTCEWCYDDHWREAWHQRVSRSISNYGCLMTGINNPIFIRLFLVVIRKYKYKALYQLILAGEWNEPITLCGVSQ